MKDETYKLKPISKKARFWERSRFPSTARHKLGIVGVFTTYDASRYAVLESGQFINTTRDRRPPKERKRERRLAREARVRSANA